MADPSLIGTHLGTTVHGEGFVFTRAFSRRFGMAPTAMRRVGVAA